MEDKKQIRTLTDTWMAQCGKGGKGGGLAAQTETHTVALIHPQGVCGHYSPE